MNLQETVKALEAKGITVAITLGVHQHCAIDSNCPLAVELRRLVVGAGVTLEQLLEGYEAVTATDPVNYDLPEVSSKVSISIAGKDMEFELDDIISGEMKGALDGRFRDADRRLRRIKELGGSLHTAYLTAIAQARRNRTLPQLSFSVSELLSTGCLVTTDEDRYAFLFPVEYKPEYLVTGGTRYKMADSDIEDIKRQAYLKFIITRDNKFVDTTLHKDTGAKLRHYHGDRSYDCWGAVTLPTRWDGRLRSLVTLVTSLMGSLATINLDSILVSHPPDMPSKTSLLDRSTEMGREGELEPQTEAAPAEAGWTTDAADPPRTGWGRGRRTGRTPARELTREEEEGERMRRFGVTGVREYMENLETLCSLCGQRAGGHYWDGTVCPRDRGEPTVALTEEEEYMRRWGVATDNEAARLTRGRANCALCGAHYNDHSGWQCPE